MAAATVNQTLFSWLYTFPKWKLLRIRHQGLLSSTSETPNSRWWAMLIPGMKKTCNGQFHKPYFDHMRVLHPSLQRVDNKISGIADHMLMNKKIVHQLFKLVEDYHSKSFWRVFIDSVNWDLVSPASEFEIYFNYIAKYHNDTFILRPLYTEKYNPKRKSPVSRAWFSLGKSLTMSQSIVVWALNECSVFTWHYSPLIWPTIPHRLIVDFNSARMLLFLFK